MAVKLKATAPATLSVPVALSRSAEAGPTSILRSEPDASVAAPATERWPTPFVPAPGDSVPPLATVTEPTVPLPCSVPPAFTVSEAEDAIEPSTCKVPPATIVAPV